MAEKFTAATAEAFLDIMLSADKHPECAALLAEMAKPKPPIVVDDEFIAAIEAVVNG